MWTWGNTEQNKKKKMRISRGKGQAKTSKMKEQLMTGDGEGKRGIIRKILQLKENTHEI